MIQRCCNPKNPAYNKYGGLDISVDWFEFKNFLKDMGARPDGMTLERVDNNKGYNAANCKWATSTEQCLNRGKFKNSTSKYKGVSFDPSRNKWRATLSRDKKTKQIGRYNTEEDARTAYLEEVEKYG